MTPQQITLNGNGGAFVTVVATAKCTRWAVVEDALLAGGGTGTAQGLVMEYPEDNYTHDYAYQASQEPIPFPPDAIYPLGGQVRLPQQGNSGDFNYIPASVLFRARSLSATATVINIFQFD